MLRVNRTDGFLLGLSVLVKLVVLLVGAGAYVWIAGGRFAGLGDALAIWNRWDAPHYLDLAVLGYRASDPGNLPMYSKLGDLDLFIVFYPLFPWLVGVVNALIHDAIWSGFVVASAASLLIAPLLHRLVRPDEGPAIAMRAAIFALIFPTAYFLHIPYTESLFLALVLGSFLAARNDRWWLAGVLGGLAALTRVNGLVLIPALAVQAAAGWARLPREERRFRAEWLGIGLVAVGFGVYLLLNQLVYGDPFTFLRILHEHWYKSVAPPWVGIRGIFNWFANPDPNLVLTLGGMELLFVAIGLAGTIHMALRRRWAWFVWMAGNWLLFVSTGYVQSVPRYSLTLFPLFVSMALLSRRRWLGVAMVAASIAGLLFFSGQFATGQWAF